MMEKQNTDSMTTVQMKADYAASEIYSTASEAPPAYPMREASSVKIAKIIAVTILLSSVIIGSFVLASSYLQARSSCDQMHALDMMLDKELMLETLQQELPKAEALLQTAGSIAENGDDDEDDKAVAGNSLNAVQNHKKSSDAEQLSDSDSSYSENDESADLNRANNGVNVKLPVELNLSELAHNIMQNNQKSRMNCVIERRQAEEIIDDNDINGGLMYNGEPKKRVTGERMSIFCESGTEAKAPEPQPEQMPPMIIRPIPYGGIPQHFPLTHMPMQMEPRQAPLQPQSTIIQRLMPHQFIVRQIQMQPQQQPQPNDIPPAIRMLASQLAQQAAQQEQPESGAPHLVAVRFNISPNGVMQPMPPMQQAVPNQPEQVLTAPRPMPNIRDVIMEMRNKREREIEAMAAAQRQHQEQQQQQEQQEQQQHQQELQQQQPSVGPLGMQMQRVPLSIALQRVGITPNDLRNIQRMAEERIQLEVRQMNSELQHMHEAASSGDASRMQQSSSSSTSESSGHENSDESSSESSDSDEDSQILQIGRATFGRSVVTPIRIPVNLMQAFTQVENMAANEKAVPSEADPRSFDEARPSVANNNDEQQEQ